jgi:hypothetical protein
MFVLFIIYILKLFCDGQHNTLTALQELPKYPIQLMYRTLINQFQLQQYLYHSIRRCAVNQPGEKCEEI